MDLSIRNYAPLLRAFGVLVFLCGLGVFFPKRVTMRRLVWGAGLFLALVLALVPIAFLHLAAPEIPLGRTGATFMVLFFAPMVVVLIAAHVMRDRVGSRWAALVAIALTTFVVWYVCREASGYFFGLLRTSG